ncbi:hypothetical protein FJT64_016379 [Amphibalanus amphitrite]|uniref:Uncharacterized protein n=1 Tax=Amphibalanus amphitrite TaxID=1232801 RepID=A0A6A4XCZ3_AMPAM|nr:hypothetical protein FJT64_016379 [Amphibalanus amphitrite]
MSQYGRKRSASCREETQSSSAWEPASKRLRSLVHQMRSLSLGDLPWSRRKVVLDVRPPDPPPTPDATPLPEPAAAAQAAPEPRRGSYTAVNHSCSFSVPSPSLGGTDCPSYGGGQGAKRTEDEPSGSRAKKARNRMRLGQNGVVMTFLLHRADALHVNCDSGPEIPAQGGGGERASARLQFNNIASMTGVSCEAVDTR